MKTIDDYVNQNWTYTVEKHERYYVVCVNELPGICTDAESLNEAMANIKEAIRGAIELHIIQDKIIPIVKGKTA